MKKLTASIIVLVLLLTACAGQAPEDTTVTTFHDPTDNTTQTGDEAPETTEPPVVSDVTLVWEGGTYASLDDLMTAAKEMGVLDQPDHTMTIEGLQTPVTFQMRYEIVVGYTVYGYTFGVEPEAQTYSGLYGNLWADLYDYQDAVILNVWHTDIGYTLIMMPNGAWTHYPTEGRSLMVYADMDGELLCRQTATKFNGSVEQWDTAPIDLAISRDDFFYATGDCVMDDGGIQPMLLKEYTISDVYDLDQIFTDAKVRGEYPEFDTLDDLLESNRQEQSQEETDPQSPLRTLETYRPDGTLKQMDEFFDQRMTAQKYYDEQERLIRCDLYDLFGQSYTFTFTYGDHDQPLQIICTSYDTEVFRYTMTYDQAGRLIQRERTAEGDQTGLHLFEYDENGSTETFLQDGQKKYTYYFDTQGDLYRHITYQDGIARETQDVESLVKVQLLLEGRLPFIDNCRIDYVFQYDGCDLIYSAECLDCLYETTYGGSFHKPLTQICWPDYDGERLDIQYVYDEDGQLVEEISTGSDGWVQKDSYTYEGDTMIRRRYDDQGELSCEMRWTYDQQGREIRYEIWDAPGETFRRDYQYSDDGKTVEITCYRDGAWESTYTEAYGDDGLLLSQGNADKIFRQYGEDGMLHSVITDWAGGASFFDYRVVYVTQDQAKALTDQFNHVLNWLY